MKTLKFEDIAEIPPPSTQRGPRKSVSRDAYEAAQKSASGKLRVTGDPTEVERFYKSMIQWRNRHGRLAVHVRKDGDKVYVWVDKGDPGTKAIKSGKSISLAAALEPSGAQGQTNRQGVRAGPPH
ncbi:MAG: hypothetical protein HY875_03945 [Chloroflexi bacterium]|nr:hypothetical protein [Chloroflexota bacterium]